MYLPNKVDINVTILFLVRVQDSFLLVKPSAHLIQSKKKTEIDSRILKTLLYSVVVTSRRQD